MKKDLILIDGNSLLFRAYFAMRPMITSTGIHTQGVFAFINMLTKITKDYNPEYIAVAFDMKDKTFRHLEYPEYKAGRQQTPIELLSEIPYMHRVLEAMNIAVFEKSGYEADDLIGTIASEASKAGMDTLIISGDKDELQLVDEHVNVLINKKGMTEFQVYDLNEMKSRYGLTPKQFIDLKGLMGDKSDNIPGIAGVGEKKGIALLEEYGSLEGVIEHASEIKGKLGENVRANIDTAVLSKWLATIKTDCPIELAWEDLKFTSPDIQALIEVYKELEFNTFIKRLQAGSSSEEDVQENENIFDPADVTVLDFRDFIDKCPSESDVVIELITNESHTDIPTVEGVALYSREKNLFTYKSITPLETELVIGTIADRKYKLYGSDLRRVAYAVKAVADVDLDYIHDVNVAEYMIYPNQNKYAIGKMLLKYYSYVTAAEDDSYYGESFTVKEAEVIQDKIISRAGYIALIAVKQREVLDSLGLSDLFDNCEMPLVGIIASMETQGIRLDADVLKDIGENISTRVSQLEAAIYEEAGRTFNINSPKQLAAVLFEEMEIPYPKKKSKTGSYSTAADILDKLASDYGIVSNVLEYRKLTKLHSTYVEGLLGLEGSDGRIHPHFMQTVAATGRLSCTEPNLQNIPIRDDYGRLIRKAFVAGDESRVFTGADYSQIELRVLAALSGDENLIQAFNEGKDIHRMTASRVFDVPFDEVTSLDRTRAKAVNFGVVYGMSSHGLSESLHIGRAEAQKYIDDYFEAHAAVKNYLDSLIEEGESNRAVRTYFGRIRQIPEFESRKFMDRELAKRLAMNTPIQGTAADIIKLAMIKVHKALKSGNYESRLILQIHDELIIEGPESEAPAIHKLLKECMETAVDFAVALTVEINSASCWYDLK